MGLLLCVLLLGEAPIADSAGLSIWVKIAAVPVLRSELANLANKELIGEAKIPTHAALMAACCLLLDLDY